MFHTCTKFHQNLISDFRFQRKCRLKVMDGQTDKYQSQIVGRTKITHNISPRVLVFMYCLYQLQWIILTTDYKHLFVPSFIWLYLLSSSSPRVFNTRVQYFCICSWTSLWCNGYGFSLRFWQNLKIQNPVHPYTSPQYNITANSHV